MIGQRMHRTYFSHSYRSQDRELNLAVWKAFAEQGFFFTVDPPSDELSVVYLEWSLRQSDCFVAAVPYRSAPARTSPYIEFEVSMAALAQKAGLIIVDRRFSDSRFDGWPRDSVIPYDPDNLEALGRALPGRVVELKAELDARKSRRPPCGRIGLLVDWSVQSAASAEVQDVLRMVARHSNFDTFQDVGALLTGRSKESTASNTIGDLSGLERLELVILDVSGRSIPTDIIGRILGLRVPTIKLVPFDPERAEVPELPDVIRRLRIHTLPSNMTSSSLGIEALTYWSSTDELARQVSQHLQKIDASVDAPSDGVLDSLDRATSYFERLGRARARIFVSASSKDRSRVQALVDRMSADGFDLFFYRNPDSLPPGENWPAVLARELESECTVFVALISPNYSGSKWCVLEMDVAKRRARNGGMVILPFKLGEADISALELGAINAVDVEHEVAYGSPDFFAKELSSRLDNILRRDDIGELIARAQTANAARATLALPAVEDTQTSSDAVVERPGEKGEAFVGPARTTLPVLWIYQAAEVIKAVAKVDTTLHRRGSPSTINGDAEISQGTGWLIAPGLLLTCWHVIAGRGKHQDEWQEEVDLPLQLRATTAAFGLVSEDHRVHRYFYLASEGPLVCYSAELDYALLRVRSRSNTHVPGDELSTIHYWGHLPLAPAGKPLNVGQRLNIPQHPAGLDRAVQMMEVAARKNYYRCRLPARLNSIVYTTDTAAGSSGAPVLDDQWLVRAMHTGALTGGRAVELLGEEEAAKSAANIGMLIGPILDDIRREAPEEATLIATSSAELIS